ncbi:DNA polymerase III subunit psi [Polynucleobacter sp. MWH-Berg-3C6]|uniref:DNA polymerase III subunit psi n=1 Tax=Polynucleobacter sp. MWH-Berg-3C6 TaxID=1855882 RepID=UPI001C0DEA3D|nr:DNA polymerase III subunit psi [Polynucleobacter sp. MWH-Berg-3C6]MBU3550498.1 DNA polymerase III subunit psi [Polynucleobacter sp. MWH-Berg-3C6]
MSNTHSAFLKEMGITEWSSKDGAYSSPEASPSVAEKASQGHWWFFGAQPQGEAQVLFQGVIRALGLGPQEWSWKNASDDLKQLNAPDSGLPVVAFAFGSGVAQKITGEKDALPQLRETILALNNGSDEEIPVIASFDLVQLVAKPKDKVFLWQDLLLARSVLQNI